MAKQSGIHQIRGKVGEMSYYKQAGVASGLIRTINQGMSSRVKTAEEYMNTRLNNREFRNANQIATYGYRLIPRKLFTTFRRFAIAEMTKGILPYIKSGSGSWGARIPLTTMDVVLADALDNRAKNGVYGGEFGTYTVDADPLTSDVSINVEVPETTLVALKEKGIDSFLVDFEFGILADVVGQSVDGITQAELLTGLSGKVNSLTVDTHGSSVTSTVSWAGSAADFHIPVALYNRILNASNHGVFCLITFIPLRDIDQTYYPLYQDGTFLALPCGQFNPA